MIPLAIRVQNLREDHILLMSYRCWNLSSNLSFEYFHPQGPRTLKAHS